MAEAFAPFEQPRPAGRTPARNCATGNQEEIVVYPVGSPERQEIVKVKRRAAGRRPGAIRDSLRRAARAGGRWPTTCSPGSSRGCCTPSR